MDPLIKDILAQPKVLRDNFPVYAEQIERTAEEIERDFHGVLPNIIFTGMGASYFACQVPFNYFAVNGIWTNLRETSELLYYQHRSIPDNALLFCISQSGESVELKKLLANLPQGVKVLTITNNPESTAGRRSDYVLNMNVESDYSVAVKTYISSILISLMLAERLVTGRVNTEEKTVENIAAKMEKWLEEREEKTEEIVEFMGKGKLSYIATGRGPSTASAMETALLFKEGAKELCADITGGQFRHGSVEVVGPNTRVINFAPAGITQDLAFSLTRELLEYGAKVLLISDGSSGLKHPNLLEISLASEGEFAAPIYDILPCQLLAHYLARAKGIEPGTFVNTVPVITSE